MVRLKIGIIGCGGIATQKHMPALKAIEGVEMVAFCDIIEERAQLAAKSFATASAAIYTDYRRLLEDTSIDVVHVLTPNRSHAEISIAALEAGKHVMCEKPMAKSAAEARAMVAAAKKSGKLLTIGYQHRHKPESRYVKAIIQDGDLGSIYYAKAWAVRRRGTPNWGVFLNEYEQGGGPLIDIGTHSLDLALYMMQNYTPRLVVGTTYKMLPNPDCGNPWGPWDTEQHTVEDAAFGFIVMEDGATIILESSWALNTSEPIPEGSIMLCGTKAGVQIRDGVTINADRHGFLIDSVPQMSAGGVAYYDGLEETSAFTEARRWIEAIREDKPPVVLPEEACVVSEILEAIYVSAKSGQPVLMR